MISVTINNKQYQAKEESTILDVCRENHIYVPTMCFFDGLPAATKCGLCVIKIDGSSYAQACITPVKQSMVVDTDSPDVISKAQASLDKFIDMSLPPKTPEIEDIYQYLYPKRTIRLRQAETTNSVKFSPSTCIMCHRCVRICSDTLQINALNDPNQRLRNNSCIGCGLCTTVCPTDAFVESPSTPSILRALGAGMTMALLISPSVSVTLKEIFPDIVDIEGRIITAAKLMGFSHVYSTSCGTDISVFEETSEFMERIENNQKLPMFSSHCPAWINFVEKFHPELIPNLASIKSPHVVLARLVRNKISQQKKMDHSKIFIATLTPCVAAKEEIKRMQLNGEVQCVITSREFVSMLSQYNIDISIVKTSTFDPYFSTSSRTAALDELPGYHASFVMKTSHAEGDPTSIHITKGKAETALTLQGKAIKIAVCSGIGDARELIESGHYLDYSYIEVLACPYGCVGGGGQLKTKQQSVVKARLVGLEALAQTRPELGALPISDPSFKTHFEPQESVFMLRPKQPVLLPIIAYGSVMGHAQQFARVFGTSCGATPLTMNQVSILDIKKCSTIVFIVSTTDDGNYPMNSELFFKSLSETNESLSGVRFAIYGLGSKRYARFCQAAKDLNALMLKHGAEPITPMAESDASCPDRGLSIVEKWATKLAISLNYRPPRFGTKLVFSIEPSDDQSVIDNPLRPVGFEIAELISSTLLTPEKVIPPMHQYVIKLPHGMDYETGDHFTILPENDPSLVDDTIKALGLSSNDVYVVHTSMDAVRTFIPNKVSVLQLFRQYLDLNGSVDRFIIQAFMESADDDTQKELQSYLDNDTKMEKLIADMNIAEFISKYGEKSSPPLDRIMSACPHIQPRVFSIASAPSSNRGYLELLVHSVVFGPNNKRKGLATYFLQRKGLKYIAVHCHKGVFTYPSDKSTPIILCGIGSGLAPLLAVLQHRLNILNDGLGQSLLFFGARFRSSYPLLLKKLATLKERTAVNGVFTAFSRDGPQPLYIQDILKDNAKQIWNLWKDPRTVIYYCGPRRGIPDDIREILTNVTMNEGQMTRDMAETFCQQHQFVMESFG